MINLTKGTEGTVNVTGADNKTYVCKYDKSKDEFKIPKEAGYTRKTIRTSNLKWTAEGKASIEDTAPVTYVRKTSPKSAMLEFVAETADNKKQLDRYKDMWEIAVLNYKIDQIESAKDAVAPTIESVFKKEAEAVKKFIVTKEQKELAELKKMLADKQAALAESAKANKAK